MKTQQEIEELARAEWKIVNRQIENGVNPHAYILGFLKGFKARDEMDEWISVVPMSVETAGLLVNTDLKLIQCLFDNGDIRSMNDPHLFAKLTHLLFLPPPPKTEKERT